MRVLSAQEMAAVDRRAIEELGIPGPVLMENAALGTVDALAESFPAAREVAIFCGPGNNGGDGYAMARLLDARQYGVEVFRLGRRPSGDALLQLEILERSGRDVLSIEDEESMARAARSAVRADVIVDALFGTGLSRPLDGLFARCVRQLDGLGRPILAVDLPSGLDGSRAVAIGPHLRADLTVTFAAPKVAQILAPACEAVGELVIADLGIPRELVAEAPGSWHLLRHDDLAAQMIDSVPGAHKGTFGHALIVAGARGTSGAAILAAQAAIRSGSGLVSLAVCHDLVDGVEAGSLESMTVPLTSRECLGNQDVPTVLDAATGKDAVALGPGLGQADETVEALHKLVAELEVPLVLDADGLNALRGDLSLISARRAASVLTPHPGEMARLLKSTTADVEADRPAAALELARRGDCVAVLKGRRSLIALPDGTLFINPTGNAGMATGGSGDVLTGAIAALLAQGYAPAAAACLGVYAHGRAGDLAATVAGRAGLAASDLLSHLPTTWRELESDSKP